MVEGTRKSTALDRLEAQLAGLLAEDCCEMGEMIVFPVPVDSSSLADLRRSPQVVVERIGPDVVRVRRAA